MTEAPEAELAPDLLDSSEAGGRYLRGAGMRILAWGGGLLVGVGATPFVTRHLGSVRWGQYVTVTALILIVAALTEGGLGNQGIREFSTGSEEERRHYLRTLLGLRIALSVIAAICALGFAFVAGYPRVLIEGTALLSIGILFSNLYYTLAIVLTTQLRLGWLAVMDFMAQAVTAVGLVALVIAGAPLLPFFLVFDVATLSTLLLTIVLVRKDVSLRPDFSPTRWRGLLSETVVYAAATTLGVVYFRLVVVAMNLLGTPAQTGYFGLGFRILDVTITVPWLLVTSAFPIVARAARDDAHRLQYALQRLVEGGLAAGGAIAICFVIGAPFAVAVIGGPGFRPAVGPLRILGAGLPFTFLLATWSFALLSLKMYRQLMVVNGLAIVLAIVLCVVLIPAAGAEGGAAVSASLEFSLASGYALVLFRARPDLRPHLDHVWRIVLAVAIATGAGAMVPLPSVAALAVALVVLVAALFLFRAVPRDVIEPLLAGISGRSRQARLGEG